MLASTLRRPGLLDFAKAPVMALQDYYVLTGRATKNILRPPVYVNDIFLQADIIGVGSVPIVMLIGFFSGAVIGLQMARALATYGAQGQIGQIVSVTLVRELGPVLTAVIVAGRNAAGMASELGSMKVTEQIDAMRALGTDPVKKLVTPRLVATAVVLPLLTVIADFVGLIGCYVVAALQMNITSSEYWTSSYRILEWSDVGQGLLKPFIFGLIVASIGCFYGLRTTGGTQGVGRATTQAVVASVVWIFVIDLLITQFFVNL